MNQHLNVFIAVVERKNFSRAAEELLMTQPAVSQYIRALEEEVGARLLERTSKYVILTKAGKIVYPHAKEIVGLSTRMKTLIDDLINHAKGPLSIGSSFTFGEYILPHIIAKMQKETPDIQPEITIGNTKKIVSYISNNQLDVGIIEGHFEIEQHMKVEEFAKDYMVVVASPNHPLVQEKKYKLLDLQQERWLLRESGSGTREASDTVFEQYNVNPHKKMSFGSIQAIKEAVGAGLGISLLSRWAVQRELRNGDLSIIHVIELPFTREFSFVTASPFETKAQKVFTELLYSSKEITDLQFK